MPLPGPWILLVAFVATLGSFVGGVGYGHRAERTSWELVIAKQQSDAAGAMAKSEKVRLETERTFQEFKDKMELEHAAQETRIDAAYAANRLLLARRGGLYDIKGEGGGACRDHGVSTNTAAPGSIATSTAGCGLSAETSEALLDLARNADRTAVYAALCHRWALDLAVLARH